MIVMTIVMLRLNSRKRVVFFMVGNDNIAIKKNINHDNNNNDDNDNNDDYNNGDSHDENNKNSDSYR